MHRRTSLVRSTELTQVGSGRTFGKGGRLVLPSRRLALLSLLQPEALATPTPHLPSSSSSFLPPSSSSAPRSWPPASPHEKCSLAALTEAPHCQAPRYRLSHGSAVSTEPWEVSDRRLPFTSIVGETSRIWTENLSFLTTTLCSFKLHENSWVSFMEKNNFSLQYRSRGKAN